MSGVAFKYNHILYFAPDLTLMKAVIIGGGIAGLAAAIELRKAGCEAVVAERAPQFTEVGLGFIILPNGLEALDTIGVGAAVRAAGKVIHEAVIRNPAGELVKQDKLENCLAVKRSALIDALRMAVPAENIHTGFEFSHFEYDEAGNAVAACFQDDQRISGDIFIAADGANSIIRQMLFPGHATSTTRIKELVGIADLPDIVRELDGKLLKTQSSTEGLSLGLLPCNDQQIIWYMQFDCKKNDLTDLGNEQKKLFAMEMMNGWPDPIRYVLEQTDYSKAFMWFTKDMELLPAFHRKNIILAGDAAHLVLPFTSQGVNSALQDVITLARLLKEKGNDDLEAILSDYYHQRKDILEDYHFFGKMMASRFLDPVRFANEELPLPLAK